MKLERHFSLLGRIGSTGKVLVLAGLAISQGQFASAQSVTIGPGGSQSWTVPPCVTSINVTVAGGEGGGSTGGNGAVISGTLNVTPGQTITGTAGGAGTAGTSGGGSNGGGSGQNSGIGWPSYGGGGASTLVVGGTTMVVAGGGGGVGGGPTFGAGGAGGCPNGANGGDSYGDAGTGGTATAGGIGGPPWTAGGGAGGNGTAGTGGAGGIDVNYGNGPGGGGGGGVFGGGGGGSDNISLTSAMGGGGGGGGSSLVPGGWGCAQTNNGAGYITITYTLAASADNDGPYCVGETINLIGGGGTNYSWTGPNGFTSNLQNPTIPNATLADAGTYSVEVDGGTCIATTDVVVVEPPTPNAGPDDVICLGEYINLNGTESVTANTSNWTYSAAGIFPAPVVNFNPNANFTDPAVMVNQPGTYTFIFSENNGICPAVTDEVVVLVSETVHTTSFVSPSCEGMSDGSITINDPTGVDYSFDNGGTWAGNSTQGGFPVGTYTVISRNQYGCTDTSDVVVTEPLPIIISAGNDTLICENGTASMWASISIAGMNELYYWSHDPGTASTSTISPLANTTVMVYAQAQNGCYSDTTYVQVDVRPGLSGNITPFDTICPGYPTTIGVYGLAGGIGVPYDIVWNSGETGSGTFMNVTANPPATYMYVATITDACESTPLVLNTEVYVAPLPVPLMSVVDPTLCEPAVFEVSNITDTAMVANYTWILSDGQIYVDESPFFTEEMYHGSYDVQLIVTSPLGCIDSVTNYDFLTVYQKPVANFQWSPNPIKMFNTEVEFANQSFLGHEYYWTFEQGMPASSTVERPKIQFPDGVTGSYEVTLYVTSEHGCMDTITRIVDVLPEVLIYAPTAFTPDGDEFNQNWKVQMEGIDIYSFDLTIYNRWGEIIWESHDLEVGWDGTYNGKLVETGVYTWKIEARDALNDGKYTWNGHVNVLR